MALRAALVDRAIQIIKEPTATKVEGSTRFVNVEKSPIRVRLQITAAGEQLADGRVLTEPTPTLLTDRRRKDGTLPEWRSSQRVRVISKQLGTQEWEINGEPTPLRAKRRIKGWELVLRRTEENEVDG